MPAVSFFLAVDPSAAVRAQVAALIERERETHPAKWQRADKLHLTLVFLGQPRPEAVAALEPQVREVAAAHAPFDLRLQGAGTFVTARAPTVLWLGLGGALEALRTLQAALCAACPPAEARPYVPHLTLARAPRPGVLEPLAVRLGTFTTDPFRVEAVTLYESSHHEYRAVFSCPLGASAQ